MCALIINYTLIYVTIITVHLTTPSYPTGYPAHQQPLKPDNPAYPPRPITTTTTTTQSPIILNPTPGHIGGSIHIENLGPLVPAHPGNPPGFFITEKPVLPISETTTTQYPTESSTIPAAPKPTYPPRPEQPAFPHQPVNPVHPFYPQYPANPIPGSPGTAIGVYPPNVPPPVDPYYPNFSIAISHWPFYALPFPFNFGNVPAPGNFGTNPNVCPCANNNEATLNLTNTALNQGNQAQLSLQHGPNQAQLTGQLGQHQAQITSPVHLPIVNQPILGQHQPQITSPVHLPIVNQPGSGSSAEIGLTQIQNPFNPALGAGAGNNNPYQNVSPYGVIGFIPVVFFPTGAPCQHNGNENSPLGIPGYPAGGILPPYPCAACAGSQQQLKQGESTSASEQTLDSDVNAFLGAPKAESRNGPHRRALRSRKAKVIQ